MNINIKITIELRQSAANTTPESATASAEDDALIRELTPIFHGSRERAAQFVASARGNKPASITDLVNKLVKDNIIVSGERHQSLWAILHKYKIYSCTLANWYKRVN